MNGTADRGSLLSPCVKYNDKKGIMSREKGKINC